MASGLCQNLNVLLGKYRGVRVAGRRLLLQIGRGDAIQAVARQRRSVDVFAICVMYRISDISKFVCTEIRACGKRNTV